ncbi:hypothetical protein psal_cds_474 [Pandoravirus salinus]|uniref:Uncharacterized protein n=1 Tax=Pandoravirus salinus TaxID=1349410 RepID=S4VXQ8_9VIRU|nr:hypothetical protein psal_cds_474 [Pandoravirus salinus]AGO84246.1 hypothetical protein psal_cds_474 [Pandoravirus salinus]
MRPGASYPTADGQDTPPVVRHNPPWSISEDLDRLWIIEVDHTGDVHETVATGGFVPRPDDDDPTRPCKAWLSPRRSGPYAARVIDTTRADDPDASPLAIFLGVDRPEDRTTLFASSRMACGRGLRMEMLDLRDDAWETRRGMPLPVYSGSAGVSFTGSLVALDQGRIYASLDDRDTLAVISAQFVGGAPVRHCLFVPARGCLVYAPVWHWKYDPALGLHVLSPCGRGTVRLASGIEMTCKWPTDPLDAHAPRITCVQHVSSPSPSGNAERCVRADDTLLMTPGVAAATTTTRTMTATLLEPLDRQTLDALNTLWRRRIPYVGFPFLLGRQRQPMDTSFMITQMIAQSALRFRVEVAGTGSVTVDFAVADKRHLCLP